MSCQNGKGLGLIEPDRNMKISNPFSRTQILFNRSGDELNLLKGIIRNIILLHYISVSTPWYGGKPEDIGVSNGR